VDLIDEEDGPHPFPVPAPAGAIDDLSYVSDAGEHGAEVLLCIAGQLREQTRETRLSGARRTPEDQRGETAPRVELA
jgi:hypothetical protein